MTATPGKGCSSVGKKVNMKSEVFSAHLTCMSLGGQKNPTGNSGRRFKFHAAGGGGRPGSVLITTEH